MSEKLIAERSTGVGGSDIHHVFSLEPYGCARRLWYEKTGAKPDWEPADKPIFNRGKRLESIVLDLLADVLNRDITQQDCVLPANGAVVRDIDDPELLVHPDGYLADMVTGSTTAVVEAKTCGERIWHRIRKDGLPQGYVLQLQHAMMVTREPRGVFALLWPDGWRFVHFFVDADAALQASIREQAILFWRQVQRREAPERLDPKDKRCATCVYRTSCQGAALYEGGKDDEDAGDVMTGYELGSVATAALEAAVARYWELKPLLDEAEEMIEAAKAAIKEAIGDVHNPVDVRGARIYFRPQTSNRVDTALLKKKYADVYQACVKPGVSRPLRIYPR